LRQERHNGKKATAYDNTTTITTGQASDIETMQVSGPIDGSAPQAGINDTEKDLGLLGDGRFEEIEVIDNDFEADDSVERPEDKHDKHATTTITTGQANNIDTNNAETQSW